MAGQPSQRGVQFGNREEMQIAAAALPAAPGGPDVADAVSESDGSAIWGDSEVTDPENLDNDEVDAAVAADDPSAPRVVQRTTVNVAPGPVNTPSAAAASQEDPGADADGECPAVAEGGPFHMGNIG